LRAFYGRHTNFFQEGFVTVKIIGTLGLVMLLAAGGSAVAREAQRQRGSHPPRATQPHTRTTERQRTENGHARTDTWTGANGRTATREAVVNHDRTAGTRTRDVDYTGPNGGTKSVDGVRTKTDEGFTRNTTATNAQGQSAARDLAVSRDKETGTVTREANYSTFDGREGSKSDVIQRTEGGFSRDTARTLPNGDTHTRSVDVSCDKDAGKCVKQVEVGQP
jgi:hypothetical protein